MPKLALPAELATLRAEAKKLWPNAARAAVGHVVRTVAYSTPGFSFRPYEIERSGQTPGRPTAEIPEESAVSYGLDESENLWTASERGTRSVVVRSPQKVLVLTKSGAEVNVVELSGDPVRPQAWRWASKYGGGAGRRIPEPDPATFLLEETVWDLLYGTTSTVIDRITFDESGAALRIVREAPAHAARVLWERPASAPDAASLDKWLADTLRRFPAASAAIVLLSDRGATLTVLSAAALESMKQRPVTDRLNPAEHVSPDEVPVRLPAAVLPSHRADVLTRACKATSGAFPAVLFAVTPPDMSALEASVRKIHGDARWYELARSKPAARRRR